MPNTTLAALFIDVEAAEKGRSALAESDIGARDVHVFQPRTLHETPHISAIAKSMMIGIIAGLIIGAVLGRLATLAAPGYGPVTEGVGYILPIVLFAIMGAAGGGTLGAMYAMDATSDPALYVAQEVDAGRALVSVTVDTGKVEAAMLLLREAGSFDVIDTGHGEEARRLAGE
jgi:hypothetical protein